MNLRKELILARKNTLSDKNFENLIRVMNTTKVKQKKCDIAVALSFIKNQPAIIEPIIKNITVMG